MRHELIGNRQLIVEAQSNLGKSEAMYGLIML